MFDINHVNAFLDLVANPSKYQKYVEDIEARTKEWKDTLGASDTLAKANSKLSEAEITLKAAKDQGLDIVEKAQKAKDKSDGLVAKANEKLKELEQKEAALVAREADLKARMEKANEIMAAARKKELEVNDSKAEAEAYKKAIKEMQDEVSSRLAKLQAVMQ
jgi:chromosome segregation ATPase